MGPLSAPLAGKPGLTWDIGPHVFPWSVEVCITTFTSPVEKPQLPLEAQTKVTEVRFGP